MKHLLTTTAIICAFALPMQAAETKTESDTMTEAAEPSAMDSVTSTANDAADAISNTASDAADAVGSAAESVSDHASDAVDATGDAARSALDGSSDDAAKIMPMEGYQVVPAADVTAAELDGARVYDENREWIGEVSKIIMDPDGTVDTLIVDVGGFLGLGEKPVGLDFDAFQLQKSVEGQEIRASVKATKDQLEAMPEYDG